MHQTVCARAFLTVSVLALICSTGCVQEGMASQERGAIADAVSAAKAKGVTSIRVPLNGHEQIIGEPLATVLADESVFLVTPVGPPVVIADANSVVRWYLFHTDRILSHRKSRAVGCYWTLPPNVRPSAGQVAMPFMGGSATVDGVTVTQMDAMEPLVEFDPARQYVVIVLECSPTLAQTIWGVAAMYEVDRTGRFAQKPPSAFLQYSFVKEMMDLRNLSALERLLAASHPL